MKNYIRMLIIVSAFIVLLGLSSCDLFKPKPSPTPTSGPTPAPVSSPTPTREPTALPARPVVGYTPVPPEEISPIVIQRRPEAGQELPPDGGIQLVFDRAMDRGAVESAFAIQPAVAGKFEWRDTRILLFKPDKPLARGTLYDVSLNQAARASDGAPLRNAYQFRFATAGYLEVGQVIPAPDSLEVETWPRIMVIFNRPVVPLTSLDQQAGFPQPLGLDPPVSGKGEWLNTSIYVFQPDKPLAGGTTYTARVSGVQDTDGNPLAQDYTWRFTTQPPKVVWVWPNDGAQQVPVETSVQVQFNQAMDAGSASQAFSLKVEGETVLGTFAVSGDTLIFTPTTRLPFDTQVEARLAAGVRSAAGGEGSAEDFAWSFRTVPLPRIVRTEPADGERQAPPHTNFVIYFNTRIDPTTVMPNLQMAPPLSPTQVYTSYWGERFSLSFGAQPSTDYVVRIGPNIADPYGNLTGQSLTVRFRTRDLDPYLGLHVPDFIGTYSAYDSARLYVAYLNVNRVDLKLYRLRPDTALQMDDWYNYAPPESALVRQWTQALEAPLNKRRYAPVDVTAEVAQAGETLSPGLYLLEANAPGLRGDRWGRRHLMVVSRLNLTLKVSQADALVWATDLQSGQPAPGLNLVLYDSDLQSLGSTVTGPDGVARISLEPEEGSRRRRGHDLRLAFSAEPFALVINSWSQGVSPWDFGLRADYGLPEYRAHIYTDRPIYRPDQTVYFKGIVRAEDDVKYDLSWLHRDLPRQGEVHVAVYSPDGEQLLDEDLPLDEYGAFNGEVELAGGAALGQYYLQATLAADPSHSSFDATFQVAAYRPPEFEVIVTPEQDEIVRGTSTHVTVQVRYFSGGPVVGVPVDWNVLAEDYSFRPAWGGRYSFRDTDDPWRCFDCWWWHYTPPRRVVLSGSGVTDEKGEVRFEILRPRSGQVSDLGSFDSAQDEFQIPVTGSQRLIIEATAVGADNQYISGRGEIIAHRADYYIGLAAGKYVGKAGEPFAVQLVAVDWRGDNPRLPAKALTVQVYRREWKNTFVENETGGGRWKTETIDMLVETLTATTDTHGEATVSFVPPQGGSYRIVATGAPTSNLHAERPRSSLFVWVTGEEHISWRRENNDRINLVADKVTYLPGETAEILIPSPYQGPHVALVTVERGGILQHEVISMTSNSQVYRLPLTGNHAPNVYVSVVLIKGSAEGQSGGEGPDYKVGIVPLEVKPVRQTLNVTLTPDPAQGGPGQEVVYTLQATDAAGRPVQAGFSLDLVDKAVLSLSPRPQNAIVEAFYGKRGLGVRTSSGLAVLVERFLAELEKDLRAVPTADEELAQTGGGGAPMATAAPAAPVLDEAYSLEAPKEAAAAPPPGVEIRQEFADTAYWEAALVTDQEGKATVRVKLPDNLTTWVMRGVGVTLDTQVGEGTVELVSTKPLLIRPVTPRFFVVGDRAQLAAVVNNNTDTSLQATVALSATGVALSTPAEQAVTIPANGEVKLTWEVTVQDISPVPCGDRGGAAELVFWAVAGEYSDASKPRLATGPDGSLLVFRYSAPDIVGTAGDLPEAGARTEVIALPPRYDERQGELSIRLDPSLAAAMQDGLSYLEHYEYECTEQTVSRFLPNVLTYRALKELGLSDPELEARLPDLVGQGLDKLYSQQREDGGWGWWRDSRESNVHLTAYVVFGLIKARQAGFREAFYGEVREDVIQRGEEYLVNRLVEARDLSGFASANRQAFVLYVLAEDDKAPRDKLDDLFDNRNKLSHYGRAFLALALWLDSLNDARISTLLSDLNNAAILSATGAHWEESGYDWWAMNTDTRSTAIILDALARIPPPTPSEGEAWGGGLAPNVVRWLMVARKGGYWETTQETAWALIALTDWMKATGELQADYDYAVFLNDEDIASGEVSRETIRESVELRLAVADLLSAGRFASESNRLTVARGDGSGRLYYTAHLRVFLPVEDIEPVSRGIIVNRRYSLAPCTEDYKCPEVREASLGDVIRVDLTIIAPNDLYYVVVEDPLPAGGEAIDIGLATTSLLEQGPGLARQPGVVEVEAVSAPRAAPVELPFYWWWWHWYSRSELRDEKVVLFADYLPKGTYLYSYTFRATLPGDYQVIPTLAQEFYFPEVFGRSDGRLLSIGE